jgi:carboxypeptidase Q
VITWEALRLMKKLGIQPRRTVRLVLWTNEENGTRGAAAYAERYASAATNHVFALEADSGVFEPARFGFSGSLAARNMIRDITSLLTPLNLAETISGGGGADIDPIAQAGRAPTMAYMGDPTRYFTIHHTAADTVERVAPEEVSKGAAAIAVVTYVIAEMPDRLPR